MDSLKKDPIPALDFYFQKLAKPNERFIRIIGMTQKADRTSRAAFSFAERSRECEIPYERLVLLFGTFSATRQKVIF